MAFNTRIKNKRDTAANWETRDPVLLEGEIIIVTTNAGDIRFKIGDGVKTYTQLPFQDESLYNILSAKADSEDLETIQNDLDNKQDKFDNITITNDGITLLNGITKITNEDDTAYTSVSNAGFLVLDDGKVMSITHDKMQFVGVEGSVTGLGLPTDDDHAANKGYVDSGLHAGAITTAGTGAAYTATVPGIIELTAGVSFIMVPHVESTSTTVTLNVNGLGAKNIKRRASTVTGTLKDGYADSWLGSGNPIHVIYNGIYWVVQGMEQPNVYDLSGAVPITKGGTGYTAIADTTYTTARYRASALYAEESIIDPTTNGVINWAYA